jgi:hypothetical protein
MIHCASENPTHDERGAVAITVAVSMVVLLGIAAITIDGGRGMTDRRSAQNAADHAALTAAWSSCQSTKTDPAIIEADAIAEGVSSSVSNGYPVVNVELIGDVATEDHRYRATVTSVLDGTFSSVIGFPTITVQPGAVGRCVFVPGEGDYAIFAGGSCPGDDLSITGNLHEIYGGVHSNGILSIQPSGVSGSTIYGPVTYVVAEKVNTDKVTIWDDESMESPGFPYSVGFIPISDVADPDWVIGNYDDPALPGTSASAAAATGNYHKHLGGMTWSGSDVIDEGLHFVDGDVKILPGSVSGERVTIVATGQIEIQGTLKLNATSGPWELDGLGMFTPYDGFPPSCTPSRTAIKWSTSDNEWGGVQYAPNGAVDMSAASNSTFSGSIIAYQVGLSGSTIQITKSPLNSSVAEVVLELEE